jgi:hypothetical protein
MCAEKSEGASYGMEALALGGLTETGLLLAHNRHRIDHLDHLVGKREQLRWDVEIERFSRIEVND